MNIPIDEAAPALLSIVSSSVDDEKKTDFYIKLLLVEFELTEYELDENLELIKNMCQLYLKE